MIGIFKKIFGIDKNRKQKKNGEDLEIQEVHRESSELRALEAENEVYRICREQKETLGTHRLDMVEMRKKFKEIDKKLKNLNFEEPNEFSASEDGTSPAS